VLIVHPVLILVPSAIAYLGGFATFPAGAPAPYCTGGTCIAAHNFTAVLYEFTSEAANNGSALYPLNDSTFFFNLAGALVMLLGRFLPIAGMLVIAARFAEQDVVAPGPGTLHTASATFTVYLALILVIGTALLFLPVMALGPLSQLGS
jgi:K+-transporting ATPase ATPase A chain